MALEILVPNPAIRNLIREDKIHQIYSQMQIGQAKFGMVTLNQTLADLFLRQMITMEDAFAASSDQEELKQIISNGQAAAAGAGRPGQAPPRRA